MFRDGSREEVKSRHLGALDGNTPCSMKMNMIFKKKIPSSFSQGNDKKKLAKLSHLPKRYRGSSSKYSDFSMNS
jgi:hypothetical protein